MKLALIGKNISHSKSEEIYRQYFQDLTYSLLDIQSVSELPSLEELFSEFDGVSVTAPYKKAYIHETKKSFDLEKLGIINTIKKKSNHFEAILTDKLAFEEIFARDFQSFINDKSIPVYLLGDGDMGKMVASSLNHFKLPFSQFSRKLKNLSDFENKLSLDKSLIINTCARDYVYSGTIHSESRFWDFNYSHPHENLINAENYINGLGLLESQAKHAVDFWRSK